MDHATNETDIRLLSDLNNEDGAAPTFECIIERIREASESIVIHMFVWRNDEIGNEIGREILSAANRGVAIRIVKDTDAFMYERIEMNRKSFFNKSIPAATRFMFKIRALTFPDTYVEDDFDFELGNKIMMHDNIAIEWVHHTHTKYYIFDRRVMITGSINIEDRHRGYRDYMVEISGEHQILRFNQHINSNASYDGARSLDFVLNNAVGGTLQFNIKPTMLDLLLRAKKSVYIEMAYIGDPEISHQIIETAKRGVSVTMLFSEAANIGNDINYRSLCGIYKRACVTVYLSPKMIHSKLMLVDDEIVILGSANISVFSMQKAVELDVVVKDNPSFIETVKKTIEQRTGASRKVESIDELTKYNRIIAALQQLHQILH